MFAIYAFCRNIDDIGDGDLPADAKRAALTNWRDRVARLPEQPDDALTRALADAIDRFSLPRNMLTAIIDGVQMDLDQTALRPDRATLALYCDRVAGAVGTLCLCVFGAPTEQIPALSRVCGHALQQTNILRDAIPDAANGRVYLPSDLLEQAGITPDLPPDALPDHPAFATVVQTFAQETATLYDRARQMLAALPASARRPTRALLETYAALLDRLNHDPAHATGQRVRLGKLSRIWIATRYAIAG